MNDPYNNPDNEADAADRRIENIVGGGRSAPRKPAPEPEPIADFEDDYENDSVARARSRANSARSRLGRSEPPPAKAKGRSTSLGGQTGMMRNQKALLFIAALVGAGILVVLIIVFVAGMFNKGAGNIFSGPTATPTVTETPQATPTPTKTPPTTLSVPTLLTCIRPGATMGCTDFCQQAANAAECNSARSFITAQDADANFWFQCVSPGPGANQGDPYECLVEAWHKANP
jgi:hypothetical protein